MIDDSRLSVWRLPPGKVIRNLADGVGDSEVTTRPSPIATPVQTVTRIGPVGRTWSFGW